MGHKVDMTEVEQFSEELEKASSNLDTQLNEVKKSIEAITNMKSFSGKAADSAKQYFTGVHLTLIESLGNLFEDMQENVEQHKKTFGIEVDTQDSAVIRSQYLQEIEEDMKEVYEELEDEDETIHDTIDGVTDISSAESPDFSDVNEWKNNSIKKLQEVDEDLDSFTGTGDEVDVDEIIQQIESVIDNAKTHKGQSRFSKFFGASTIKELDQLKAYNKLKGSNSDELIEELSDKLMNEEKLSSEEKEILFQHFQDELTDEDHKHMDELASKIEDEEALKGYVNEKVLYSEENLEEEISLLQKYLYTGNMHPGDLPGDTDDRAKLHSYLDILKNHHIAINEVKSEDGLDWGEHSREDPLMARVEYIKLEEKGDSKNNNYYQMTSEISIDYYQEIDEDKGLTRESYVEGPLAAGRKNQSKVVYYKGEDAISGMINEEKNEEQDKLDNMDAEFYDNKLMGYIISGGKKTAESVGKGPSLLKFAEEIIDHGDHKSEKAEQNHTVNLKEHEEIASDLSVELKTSERNVPYTWKGVSRQIEIYPTDETFEKLRRWEAVHNEHPNAIPFDAEAVINQDWEEIHNVFGEIDDSEHEDLYNYIINRKQSDSVEQIDKELYYSD